MSCPCSLWGPNTTVPVDDRDSGDPTPVEVGVKFKSDKFGTISGLRFYKAAANTGTHIGSLWSESGQRARAGDVHRRVRHPAGRPSRSARPVAVQPNTTYVASYYAPNGHYSASAGVLLHAPAPGPIGGAVVDSPPLHAVRNTGTDRERRVQLRRGQHFPSSSFGGANYWVDVIYTPMAVPGTVTGVSATAGGLTSANVTWSAPASGGAVTSYRITPYVGSTAQTATTITGSPPVTTTTITGLTTGTTYTFRVEAINPNGTGPASAASNPVTPLTAVAPSVPRSVSAQPASQSARVDVDGAAVRRRQRDHRLHGDAVHRRHGADAGAGRRGGDGPRPSPG